MNEKEYLDWIKESVKAGIRFRKQFEHTLADAAIEEGILPDPTQLTNRERAVWMEETSELQFPTSITELSHTWEKAKARIESENVNAAAKSNLTPHVLEHEDSQEVRVPKKSGEKRGMKAGTAERVREFHRLVKSGMSQRQAKRQSHCDPSTYNRWCLEATGEEPIQPYR